MAWRPNDQFIEGVLDNTVPNKVTGWMKFADMEEKVIFNLEGNFHRDIRGAKIRLTGEGLSIDPEEAKSYMQGFDVLQQGKVGDMTAGGTPQDYVDYGYFEWYSDSNGRCVIELEPSQIELLAQPIPACESDPISRKEQNENFANYLGEMAVSCGIPKDHAIATSNNTAVKQAKTVIANDKMRGMKLLPKDIREKLPALYSQDGKGGKAVVYLKMFSPDSNWTWLATEGEPILDDSGSEIDFQFFGLVDGLEKELGYFNLSELESAKGPMGLPIERDLYFQPKTLQEIAPEMFKGGDLE